VWLLCLGAQLVGNMFPQRQSHQFDQCQSYIQEQEFANTALGGGISLVRDVE